LGHDSTSQEVTYANCLPAVFGSISRYTTSVPFAVPGGYSVLTDYEFNDVSLGLTPNFGAGTLSNLSSTNDGLLSVSFNCSFSLSVPTTLSWQFWNTNTSTALSPEYQSDYAITTKSTISLQCLAPTVLNSTVCVQLKRLVATDITIYAMQLMAHRVGA